MFRSARIKLTLWYSLIITVISVAFSVAVYRLLTLELDRVSRIHRVRIERQFSPMPPPFVLDEDVINEAKQRLQVSLLIINLIILTGSASAGYLLAGKTLRPIKDMVEDQNQFISDASHELRTPLTALKSEIEVTLRDKQLSDAELKKILMSNLEEVNHLQALTDGLITLTQLPANHRAITVADILLSRPILQAIQKTSAMAKKKKIVIESSVTDCVIEGEITSLTELFIIFIDNAIKYSPKGSAVSISCESTEASVLVSITDHGMGISEKDIPHVFDRFYRADKARVRTDVSGYGLGLSIAKQIVDKYHGSISVKSKPGSGSTFTIKLPIHQTKSVV